MKRWLPIAILGAVLSLPAIAWAAVNASDTGCDCDDCGCPPGGCPCHH